MVVGNGSYTGNPNLRSGTPPTRPHVVDLHPWFTVRVKLSSLVTVRLSELSNLVATRASFAERVIVHHPILHYRLIVFWCDLLSMELILRLGDHEVVREVKLSAPVGELLRRISISDAKNPKETLAFQIAQEISHNVCQEPLVQLVKELIGPDKS